MSGRTVVTSSATLGAASEATDGAGRAAFTILHFNDVYEISPVEGGRVGGLARVATLRRRLVDSVGPVLTTLGGDFLSPSALGTATVDGARLAGRQMVAVLNAVGLDWTAFGNHEFDLSEALFRARLAESRFRYVASNVTDSAGRRFPGTVPHAIVPIAAGGRTIRVGLVSAVTSMNRQPWVRYADPIAALAEHAALIRDSVDLVVALTHLGVADDERVAERVGDVDLILGGHEHENYVLRRGSRLVPIVKGDANVRTVAVVRVALGRRREAPQVDVTIVPVTNAVPADPTVDAVVRHWTARAFDGYRADGFAPESIVATLREPLDGRESVVRTGPGTLSDILLAAMRAEAPSAEVAIFNGGSIRIDDIVPAGALSQYDVIRILPFGGQVVRATLAGALLRRVLQVGVQNAGTGGFLHVAGAQVDGERITVGGAPLEDERAYRVVLTDYLLTGNEVNLAFLTARSEGVADVVPLRDVRRVFMDELRRR